MIYLISIIKVMSVWKEVILGDNLKKNQWNFRINGVKSAHLSFQ